MSEFQTVSESELQSVEGGAIPLLLVVVACYAGAAGVGYLIGRYMP